MESLFLSDRRNKRLVTNSKNSKDNIFGRIWKVIFMCRSNFYQYIDGSFEKDFDCYYCFTEQRNIFFLDKKLIIIDDGEGLNGALRKTFKNQILENIAFNFWINKRKREKPYCEQQQKRIH
ncbi:hypothetical protein BpHYR1_016133 [Brachionus plicatilis]|uniref:Uncharacterized protein n=1 Tax=Brachionus plicatilis TaxID=10195 RepID=A0A3M7QQ85_BRAPC|nr:hypothetical protein BpHYR1_016133 [Brachionus plicatilis]